MQTFLPYVDYDKSAEVLDKSRLGNQFYREGLTLLRGGWVHHPVAKMWRGHKGHLCLYLLACSEELNKRGLYYPHHDEEILETYYETDEHEPPPWLGYEEVHESHRANLLRKDPVWYGQFGWVEEPKEGYVWPV